MNKNYVKLCFSDLTISPDESFEITSDEDMALLVSRLREIDHFPRVDFETKSVEEDRPPA